MKCSLVIMDDVKQIVLTPEDKKEEFIISLLKDEDKVTFKSGEFNISESGYTISECKGGWLRGFEDKKSLILVLKPSEAKEKENV